MSTPPHVSATPSLEAEGGGETARRAVFVVGSGRSGTSTFAGSLQQLGLHVPQPEVVADETNPRGFGEPQWVIDFHNRLLRRCRVQVSDARPQAWSETGRLGERAGVREEASGWLASQTQGADELVIKDPRLSWFLGLWRAAATRCDVTPCFATMLRPPMEVISSKQQAYGRRVGDINAMAAWVNMMLHTERTTRGSVRVFIRYHDLLQDWTTSIFHAGEVLGLQSVRNAGPDAVRRVFEFIDPSLRREQTTWDEFDGPDALRELATATWESLDRLAGPDGDTAAAHERLDELREAYTRMYAEAEALAKSTTIAATRRAADRAADRAAGSAPAAAPRDEPAPAAAPPSRADRAAARIPHRVRAMVPARVRGGVRRLLDGARRERGG
jgi:hypothetical protein